MLSKHSTQDQNQRQGLPEEILVEEALKEKKFRTGVPFQLRLRKKDEEIAEYLGFPVACVRRLIQRVLLETRTFDCKSKGKLSSQDLEWIGWMHDYNISYKEIAKAADFDELKIETIARSGSKHYRPVHRSEAELTPEDKEAIEDLFFLNKSAGEVAKQIGIEEAVVAGQFKELVLNYNGGHSKNKNLSYDDLKIFEYGRRIGISQNRLSKIIGCSSGTLSEIVKNCKAESGEEFSALDAYKMRLDRKKLRQNTHYKEKETKQFLKELTERVESGSESVKSFCSRNDMDADGFDTRHSLSYQTVYNHLNDGSLTLKNFKPRNAKQKAEENAAEKKPKKYVRPVGKPFEDLPEKLYKHGLPLRVYIEMDTVVGKRTDCQSLLTLFVEGSRIGTIQLLENKTAACVNEALLITLPLLDSISPYGMEYILTDNGTEFARCKEITSISEKLFSAHPQTPTDKPFVENFNRNIRPFFGKGETMDNATKDEVKEIERKIATRPVASLFWASPWEALQADIEYFYGRDIAGAKKAIKNLAEYFGF